MRNNLSAPVVTAVIRTFNRAHLLANAIESVLEQTFENFELIIIDDCSKDNTAEVVQSYMAADPRILYIRHKENRGTGRGFNTANAAARGKYVAYLDDDDTWREDKLKKQVEKFESCTDRVGLISGAVQYWNSDTGEKLRIWIPNRRGKVYWDSLGTSGNLFGPPSAVMIRKAVLEDVGLFREDMHRGCCQQYFRRIAKKYETDFVPDIVLDYYYHKDAITSIRSRRDIINCITSSQIKIDSTRNDLEKVPRIYAGELMKLGHYYCLYGQMAEGYSCFRRAAEVNCLSVPIATLLLGSRLGNEKIYKFAYWFSSKLCSLYKFWTIRGQK